jgi:hypothetical protein
VKRALRLFLCRLIGHASRERWELHPQAEQDAEWAAYDALKAARDVLKVPGRRPPALPPMPLGGDFVTRCKRCGVRL